MPAILDPAIRVLVSCLALGLFAHFPASAFAADQPASNEAVLLRALDRRVTVDFKDEPIQSALNALIDILQKEDIVSLAFDQRSLAEANVNLDNKVTVQATNIHVHSALNFLLGQANAAWTIKDETLLITTRKVADGQMLVFSHGVTGLAFREEDADREPDFRQLVEVIKNEIAPESWDKRGGQGSIELYAQNGYTLNRCNLVVRQTAAIHCEISRLLAELRSNAPISAAEKKLRKALDEPTVLEFVETPLSDVISYLKDLHQIEIQIDTKVLNEATVGVDQPITKSLRGMSLRSALRLMLDPLDLTFVIRDEVLLITAKDKDGKLPAEVPPDCGQTLPALSLQLPVAEPLPAAPKGADKKAPADEPKTPREEDPFR